MPQTTEAEADSNSNATDHTAVQIDEPGDPGTEYRPRSGEPPSGSDFNFADGSYTLYTLYSKKIAEFDRELVNNWTGHMSDLIVLGGLVSAAIAAFLAPSYIASLSTFEDNALSYLALISQFLSRSNTSGQGDNLSKHVPTATYALWFYGLGTSLSSAMLAMLVQSWIRRYMIMTQTQQDPRSRALIQVYMRIQGPWNSLQLAVDFLHLLLDIAIFVFLVGLYLAPPPSTSLDLGVLYMVSSIIAVLIVAYFILSLGSLSRRTISSTPFSRLARHFKLFVKLIQSLPKVIYFPNSSLDHRSKALLAFDWAVLDHVDQAAEMLSKAHPSSFDNEIVAWLLRSLHHDRDLERFLASIPSFYDSDLVKQPEQVFRPFHKDQVPRAILSFMRHTLSSTTFPDETTKQKRIMLSLEVMELDPYLLERTFFHALSLPAKPTIFLCIDFVLAAHQISSTANVSEDMQLLARCIISVAISHITAKNLDERWSRIVEDRLNFPISISDTTTNEQLVNMKLVNLVWLVEGLNSAGDEYRDKILHNALDAASSFPVPVENIVSPSQNKFCVVWNQLLESAATTTASESTATASLILPHIRTIYNALHGGIKDSPVDPNLSPADHRCTDPTHNPKNPDLAPGTSSGVVAHASASGEDPTLTTPQDVIPVANDDLPN